MMTVTSYRELIDAVEAAVLHSDNPDLSAYADKLLELLEAAGFGNMSQSTLAWALIEEGKVSICIEEEVGFGGLQSRTCRFPAIIIDSPDPQRAARQWALEQRVQRAKDEVVEARHVLEARERELVKAEEELAAFAGQA